MGSWRLLYNRYNIKRSVVITTWKKSRSLGINILRKLVKWGFYKTKGFNMIGSFSWIESFPPASLCKCLFNRDLQDKERSQINNMKKIYTIANTAIPSWWGGWVVEVSSLLTSRSQKGPRVRIPPSPKKPQRMLGFFYDINHLKGPQVQIEISMPHIVPMSDYLFWFHLKAYLDLESKT